MTITSFVRRAGGAIVMIAALALPAAAHQLSVFAKADGDSVLIEARFADGTPVRAGTLRVLDAAGAVIEETALDGSFPIRVPIGTHADGMRIEVDAGGGHENYWIMTPADLAGTTVE